MVVEPKYPSQSPPANSNYSEQSEPPWPNKQTVKDGFPKAVSCGHANNDRAAHQDQSHCPEGTPRSSRRRGIENAPLWRAQIAAGALGEQLVPALVAAAQVLIAGACSISAP